MKKVHSTFSMAFFLMFAHSPFLFISGFLTKLLAYEISFVLKEFCCGSMSFCNNSSHSLESKNKFFNYFSWVWFSVSRPVLSIFMNSLSRVTDVSTLKEETKLPFQMRRNHPALTMITVL